MIKKILAVLAIGLMLASPAYAERDHTLEEYNYATPKHFAMGVAASTVTQALIPEEWNLDPVVEGLIGVGASLILGIAIEAFDEPFDGADVAEYALGGISASLVFQFTF